MNQIIIYQNPNGPNVSVCHPSGEVPIETVLIKDCPAGARIVDASVLPQGSDAKFFNSWEFSGDNIVINLPRAKAEKLEQYNAFVLLQAQKRQLNVLAGIPNDPDDATWLAKLTADRNAIAEATNTADLVAVENPNEFG